MEWMKYIVAIFSGLAAAIPLVIKLVEYVQKAAKEKNWSEIVRLTINYMTVAENKFSNGATRKEWVMSMVQISAQSIEYNLDETALIKISEMIDSICDAAKIINTPDENQGDINSPKSFDVKNDHHITAGGSINIK